MYMYYWMSVGGPSNNSPSAGLVHCMGLSLKHRDIRCTLYMSLSPKHQGVHAH